MGEAKRRKEALGNFRIHHSGSGPIEPHLDGPMSVTVIKPQAKEPAPVDGVVRAAFAVGSHKVTMTMDINFPAGARGQHNVQWVPPLTEVPSFSEVVQYLSGRNAFYQRIANMLGSSIPIVDTGVAALVAMGKDC